MQNEQGIEEGTNQISEMEDGERGFEDDSKDVMSLFMCKQMMQDLLVYFCMQCGEYMGLYMRISPTV